MVRIARARKTATTLRIDRMPNRDSWAATLDSKRKHTTERILARFVYDDYKTSFGAGVSDARHAGTQRGEGAAALPEKPAQGSWQGRSENHRGESARALDPLTSPQDKWICLCLSGLNLEEANRCTG